MKATVEADRKATVEVSTMNNGSIRAGYVRVTLTRDGKISGHADIDASDCEVLASALKEAAKTIR